MVHIYQVVFFCLLSVCNGGVVPHLSPLISQGPLVNQGPQLGPLTAAYGDLVQTPRGLASISLEGFSEDLNQDGYVDPVGQAVAVAAPAVAIASPAPTYNIAASAFGGLATSPQVFGGFATPLVHPTGCINHLGSAVP